ncbi:helix-turn-helix domain-containing protein [Microbacterium ureisolvens]|uniref:ImmA/IrrE family metallo-endopeptidase n=1 Tax=Microbacterium ureisolvens TaxID=2781186 RepID=A0ABS7HXP5_9MICO|nr:XRE family transcriptional regulator [Microbacterium ureisolvens]MBW9110151.1 ImmA/IrrE family metallo-endopeptidase [Microbacterium ureisolvens]
MADSSAAVGARVAQARESANMTQQQLAVESGIERTALAKIERGLRRVGALELVDIAGALGVRVEWLLTDAPAAVVAHRTRQDPDLELASIDKHLERIARDVAVVCGLVPSLTSDQLDARDLPKTGSEAEALAESTRKAAGLNPTEPVPHLVDTVARVGLLAFSMPLGAETADAASTLLESGAVALINSTNSVGRRRLALAHELGHYLVKDDYTVDWSVADHAGSDRTEILLDRFARAFLAPKLGFTRFWNDVRSRHDLRTAAVLTGSEFNIDMSTIARRLLELELASSDDAQNIRSVRTTKADIVEYNLKVTYELDGTTLSSAYVKSLLGLYSNERLSAERTLQLLLGTFDRDDLPPLRTVRDDELWSLLQ